MGMFGTFTKRFQKNKKNTLKEERDVHNDWIFSLITFFSLVFVFSIIAVYIFLRAEKVEVAGTTGAEQNGNIEVIDEQLLDETIEYYSEKENRFEALQENFEGAPEI